ncbi:hypothetical protein [Dyella choica]|uniref:Nitrogen fixation protein NifZ n=1 Tax=Dyella choica TaxID=1927959 RepID=A0A432M742_9GAMM|nr:hypothetical protein [Dyella choica]RUL75975.1 hypothetical protein EKH80_09640 [Dyella choica]
MERRSPPKARLLANIPSERVEYTAGDGSQPEAGDIVALDQGYIGPNGEPMGMVVCFNADGSIRWAGDVLDSEIEVLQ